MSDLSRSGADSADVDARTAPGGRLARLLLLLAVLAGLFATHGLSADHDVAMTGSHATVSQAGDEGTAAHAAVATDTGSPANAPVPHHGSDPAELCVAVLTGAAALALLLLRPLRAPLAHRLPDPRPVRRARSRTLPLLRPPDLSVLCVLRT